LLEKAESFGVSYDSLQNSFEIKLTDCNKWKQTLPVTDAEPPQAQHTPPQPPELPQRPIEPTTTAEHWIEPLEAPNPTSQVPANPPQSQDYPSGPSASNTTKKNSKHFIQITLKSSVARIKITMDARILGDTIQVLFGIVPLISDHKGVSQNPFFYLPIILIDTKETKDLYTFVQDTILPSMKKNILLDGENWDIEWYLVADFCSLWKMTGLHWKSKDGFCLWCDAKPQNALKLDEFKARIEKLEGTFGIPVSRILFCTLHMGLRITEKLLIWLFDLIRDKATVSDTIATIRYDGEWPAFTVLERAGRLEVGGFISMAKVLRILQQRHKIIDAAV
jgi:hypothetical protein